jgi:hypothetical protein
MVKEHTTKFLEASPVLTAVKKGHVKNCDVGAGVGMRVGRGEGLVGSEEGLGVGLGDCVGTADGVGERGLICVGLGVGLAGGHCSTFPTRRVRPLQEVPKWHPCRKEYT